MRRTLCLLGFITILLYTMSSCRDKVDVNENMSVIHYTDFPEVVELTGEEYVVNDAMMQYPFRIRVIDDYLYVMDLHADENFMHILNKNFFCYNKDIINYIYEEGTYDRGWNNWFCNW